MRWAAYGAKIYSMIDWSISHDSLNRDRLKKFERYSTLLKEHEDPVNLLAISKTFGIIKAMDLIPSHLRDQMGSWKVPLSYIIRESVQPPVLQPLQVGSCVGVGYESLADELIVRAPHVGNEYVEDNAKVFQILQDMVQGTSFESSIKTFQKAHDGRRAYLTLCQHNLGSSKWDKIIDEAETYVIRRGWNRKNLRITLRSHVSKHREVHNEMMRTSQFVDYKLPNDHTRVGCLKKSITNRDSSIVSAIIHIQGNQHQRNDFEAATDFLLLTAPKPKDQVPGHRISALNTNKPKRKGLGESGVELRYHSKYEYKKLSKV